jgi:hypothetical protein
MPHPAYDKIYTSPKTPGHVLDTLWRLSNAVRVVGDFANDLEGTIIVEGTAGSNLTAGDFVYVSASGVFSLARADAALTSELIGVVTATVLSGATVSVQVAGTVQVTGWGLTAASWYYLSASVAGGKTTTAPSSAGQYVVRAGRALTSEKLALCIDPGILL